MILYIENANEPTKKTLIDLIKEFNNVAMCKTNTPKAVVFLYNNNNKLKKNLRKQCCLQ